MFHYFFTKLWPLMGVIILFPFNISITNWRILLKFCVCSLGENVSYQVKLILESWFYTEVCPLIDLCQNHVPTGLKTNENCCNKLNIFGLSDYLIIYWDKATAQVVQIVPWSLKVLYTYMALHAETCETKKASGTSRHITNSAHNRGSNWP